MMKWSNHRRKVATDSITSCPSYQQSESKIYEECTKRILRGHGFTRSTKLYSPEVSECTDPQGLYSDVAGILPVFRRGDDGRKASTGWRHIRKTGHGYLVVFFASTVKNILLHALHVYFVKKS